MKHSVTGEPLYNVLHVAMVCDECKATKSLEEQAECKHNIHKNPEWKSHIRQDRNTEISKQLDKDKNRNLREGFGLVLGSSNTIFVRESIDYLFSNNCKKIETQDVPSFILIAVDPNAGFSDMGVVSGYFKPENFISDPLACLHEAVLLSVDGYKCRGKLMHADQMNLVLSHIMTLRNRFPLTHFIVVIESQTGATHGAIAEHLVRNLKNIHNPIRPTSKRMGGGPGGGGGQGERGSRNNYGTLTFLPEKGISIICKGLDEEKIGVNKTKTNTEEYVYITNRYLESKLLYWDSKCFAMRKDIFDIIRSKTDHDTSSSTAATTGAGILQNIQLNERDNNLTLNISSKSKFVDSTTAGEDNQKESSRAKKRETNEEFKRVKNELRLQLLRIERDKNGKIHGKQGGEHDDIAIAFMMFLHYGYLLLKPYPNPFLNYLPERAIDEFFLNPREGTPSLM